ncbi:hypothetical protein TRICI_006611 [Trichomonascus ciferrii]|uniref:MAGE domain-containing protein n=1 Tax=Trichomonascus ciferrii TaxID=44093 RepID=A0A642UG59_9ASCO|nr:hypothetical protein TRICI_006611 [Trichomonascus ciferrii]
MPSKRRVEDVNEDDTGDTSTATATASSTPGPKAPYTIPAEIPHDVFIEMKKELVKMALCSELSRSTIKRSDIIKGIIQQRSLKATSTTFTALFYHANEDMKDKFGMEIAPLALGEVPEELRGPPQPGRSSKKRGVEGNGLKTDRYIVRSVLEQPYKEVIDQFGTEAEIVYMGQVGFIIMLIVLEGGLITRSKLFNEYWTRVFELPEESAQVSYTNLLSRMKRHSYIQQQKENNQNGEPSFWLFLGPRALQEFSSETISRMAGNFVDGSQKEKFDERLRQVFKEFKDN